MWDRHRWSKIGSTFQVAKAIASRKGIDINDFDGIKAFQLYDNGDEINVKLKEILDCVKDAKIFPLVRKAQYGNDANKLGALYNFLYC